MKDRENLQMKKTIALIYRFVFIVFSVWGICQHIGFNILKLSVRMYDFAFIINVMSLFCILAFGAEYSATGFDHDDSSFCIR